jgi:hypothetical protein
VPKVEADDEAYLIRRVAETGGETRKVKWQGRKGAPDRLCGWPNGNHCFIELKHPDQPWKVTGHQAREIARMRSWGLNVEVLEGRKQIDTLIDFMISE